MLDELLKHNRLGNKDELLFFLFDSLSKENKQSLLNVRKYCVSNAFSIGSSFDGIINFLQFISFIDVAGDNISLNSKSFDQAKFNKQTYLNEFHLYEHLINKLKESSVLQEMFNANNVKFSQKLSQYYVLENKFPYKYFLFRNMLLSAGFFHRSDDLPNHLLVKKQFTDYFGEIVANDLSVFSKNALRKISLAEFKKALKAKENAGKRAELFALEFEHRRLRKHPNYKKVEIISDDCVNAGYDIESFEDIDSIALDRFIEVKSYVGKISFFWSRNEVEKAKELRARYYLYLVDRSRIHEKNYKPQIFQDPYKKVFENDLWKKETENWRITFAE